MVISTVNLYLIYKILFLTNPPRANFRKPTIEKLYNKNIFSDEYFNRQVISGSFYKNILFFNILKDPYIYEVRHKTFKHPSFNYFNNKPAISLLNLKSKKYRKFRRVRDPEQSIEEDELIFVKDIDNFTLYKFKNPKNALIIYIQMFFKNFKKDLTVNGKEYLPINSILKMSFTLIQIISRINLFIFLYLKKKKLKLLNAFLQNINLLKKF